LTGRCPRKAIGQVLATARNELGAASYHACMADAVGKGRPPRNGKSRPSGGAAAISGFLAEEGRGCGGRHRSGLREQSRSDNQARADGLDDADGAPPLPKKCPNCLPQPEPAQTARMPIALRGRPRTAKGSSLNPKTPREQVKKDRGARLGRARTRGIVKTNVFSIATGRCFNSKWNLIHETVFPPPLSPWFPSF